MVKNRKFVFSLTLLIVTIAVVTLGLWQAYRANFFLVQTISYEILQQENVPQSIHADWQKTLLQLKAQHLPRQIWQWDIQQVTRDLQNKTWLQKIEILRKIPNRIHLKLTMKPVQALWVNQRSQAAFVFADGTFFKTQLTTNTPDYFVLRGDLLLSDQELRMRALQLIAELPPTGPFAKEHIAEISFDAREGFVARLIQDDVVVKLGDSNLKTRVDRVNRVVEYLHINQFDARVIDANISKKVLVRLRNDP